MENDRKQCVRVCVHVNVCKYANAEAITIGTSIYCWALSMHPFS